LIILKPLLNINIIYAVFIKRPDFIML